VSSAVSYPPSVRHIHGPETHSVRARLSERLREGCQPHEIGVFVRSDGQLRRARTALKAAGARSIDTPPRLLRACVDGLDFALKSNVTVVWGGEECRSEILPRRLDGPRGASVVTARMPSRP
jgi:hypothetical protein